MHPLDAALALENLQVTPHRRQRGGDGLGQGLHRGRAVGIEMLSDHRQAFGLHAGLFASPLNFVQQKAPSA
jgi:hypothetical protein